MKIWKYTIEAADEFTLAMPEGARVLSVGVQHGQPRIWAPVDPAAPMEPRTFRVRGTGHPADDVDPVRFIGTFMLNRDTLVFHVFEG